MVPSNGSFTSGFRITILYLFSRHLISPIMLRASHPPWPNFANSINNVQVDLKYTQTEHHIPTALAAVGGGGAEKTF